MTNFHSKPHEFCPNLAVISGLGFLPIKSNSAEGAVVYVGVGEEDTSFVSNESIATIIKNPDFSVRSLYEVDIDTEFHLTT
jgi:hypothetical protein